MTNKTDSDQPDFPQPDSEPSGSNLLEYTVSEISAALKRTVEGEYGRVRVRGEISGFKRATSGLQDSLSLDDDDFGIEADGEEKTAETEKEQPGDEEEKNPAAGEASPPEASAAAPA